MTDDEIAGRKVWWMRSDEDRRLLVRAACETLTWGGCTNGESSAFHRGVLAESLARSRAACGRSQVLCWAMGCWCSKEPTTLVVYRSGNREGQTFALAPASRRQVIDRLGAEASLHPRVFLAHATPADEESVPKELTEIIVRLLTATPLDRLDMLGFDGVAFRDPVSEQDVPIRDA